MQNNANRLYGGGACEVVLVGGLALSGDPFQPLLSLRIVQDYPNAIVREPELSPAHGAVLEAMKADGVAWNTRILANLGLVSVQELACTQ